MYTYIASGPLNWLRAMIKCIVLIKTDPQKNLMSYGWTKCFKTLLNLVWWWTNTNTQLGWFGYSLSGYAASGYSLNQFLQKIGTYSETQCGHRHRWYLKIEQSILIVWTSRQLTFPTFTFTLLYLLNTVANPCITN